MSIPLLAPVALLVDVPAEHLFRGQIGTIVEHLPDRNHEAVLVEFADEDGQTYAMAELTPDQLMVLHRRRTDAA